MPLRRLALPSFIALYALVVLQNTWLHEDAFITYRSVDNLINGYGPTWNITERVQTYTHPLWFFVVSIVYALTSEIYYSNILLCWVIAIATVLVMVLRIAPSPGNALFGIALLCTSKAFIEYSTSGLENPLSHLLLAFFIATFFRSQPTLQSLTTLSLVAGLATLNRMDTLLIYLPVLATSYWHLRSLQAFRAVAVGFAPFAAWELFSLCYYGFLVPNTAYGKLNTGIPALSLVQQGLYYLYNSLRVDPITLTIIACCTVGLCYTKKWPQLPLLLGPILYLAYTVKVGGDYMSGRFLSTPFFAAVLLIVHNLRFATRQHLYIALGAILVIGLITPYSPLRSGLEYQGAPGNHNIVDEFANYRTSTGLLSALITDAPYPRHQWVDLGHTMAGKTNATEPAVTTYTNLGILGFYAGPHIHHLDALGITDPLLARLPAYVDADWAPGHYARIMPEGYIESHLYGYNLIADEGLATYYDKLRTVISGPLWTADRWLEIWRLNTGHYDSLIEYAAYREPSEEEKQHSQARLSPPVKLPPDADYRALEAGNLYFVRRQYDRAEAAYHEAVRRRPEQPSAYHNLGAVLLAKDAKAQAIAAFQQAAERGSKTAETYRALIWLYRKTGNEQAAKQAYRLAARHIEDATAGAALSEYWNSGQ
jgi:arabinofuranosyltransferase